MKNFVLQKRLVVPLLVLVSCGPGVAPIPAPPEAEPATPVADSAPVALTLEQRLGAAEATVLTLATTDSVGSVQARQTQTQPNYTWLPLRATGGTVAARVVGQGDAAVVELETLVVRLSELPLFDTGLTLTDLAFEMTPTEAPRVFWSSDRTEASASLRVTMAVTGSVRGAGGGSNPFQTQVFADVPLDLRLTLDATGGLVASFKSQGDRAASWSWANMLETGAAKFEGRAVETPGAGQAF